MNCEMNSPGRLELMANMPLLQAIMAAGGLKDWRVNGGNVELVQINRTGSATLNRFCFDMCPGGLQRGQPAVESGRHGAGGPQHPGQEQRFDRGGE